MSWYDAVPEKSEAQRFVEKLERNRLGRKQGWRPCEWCKRKFTGRGIQYHKPRCPTRLAMKIDKAMKEDDLFQRFHGTSEEYFKRRLDTDEPK